jgi:hypothetical protein
MAEGHELPIVDLGDDVEVAGQRARAVMRWTSAMSSFVLRRMC